MTMKKWFQRATAVLLTLATAAVALTSAQAQTSPKPNLTALIYSSDGKGASARKFEPGKTDGTELFKLSERMNAVISPDAAWYVMYGSIDDAGTFAASYGKTGDPKGTPIPVDKGFTFVGGSFSPTSKYFAYTLVNLPQQPNQNVAYILAVLDTTTGKINSYPGTVVYPTDANGKQNPLPAVGFYGGPLTIGWLDETRQVLTPFVPFSDGSLPGVFVLDLSKTPPGPLPAAASLTATSIDGYSYKIFSPDRKKMAYAYSDPARPVPNYSGPYGAFNTIGVLDVATGKVTSIAAQKDEGIGNGVTFAPDGSKVYFNAGLFTMDSNTGISLMKSPKLYSADVATGQVTAGPALTKDENTSITQLIACGSTLYFTMSKSDPNQNTSQLIGAQLADPTKQTVLYSGTGFISIIDCAP